MVVGSALFVLILHLLIGPLAQSFSLLFLFILCAELLFSKRKKKISILSIFFTCMVLVAFRFYFIWYGDYRLVEEGRKVTEYLVENNRYPAKINDALFLCFFCEKMKYENKISDQKNPILFYTLFYPFERRIFDFERKQVRDLN